MLVPPYASRHYDDRSLAVRVGSVVAHEFGHCSTLLPGDVWTSAQTREALAGYLESTHIEAMADVIGVAGVLESGVVDWGTLRDHWGQVRKRRLARALGVFTTYLRARCLFLQLWCSRRSASWQEPTDGSHPSSLRRANELAKVIERFY